MHYALCHVPRATAEQDQTQRKRAPAQPVWRMRSAVSKPLIQKLGQTAGEVSFVHRLLTAGVKGTDGGGTEGDENNPLFGGNRTTFSWLMGP